MHKNNNLDRLTLKNNHFEAGKKKKIAEEVIAGMIRHFERALGLLRLLTGDTYPKLIVS